MEAIDRERIQHRFTRALTSYDSQADAQHRISRKLASLLPGPVGGDYGRILEIGCGTGGFTRSLIRQCKAEEWVLNDLCEGCREKVSKLFQDCLPRFIMGDAEAIPFPGKFDLIASASAFQWMKEPEKFLGKLARLLEPHGTLLFSTFAPGNLSEIKELTGKGLFYPTAVELAGWLSAGFDLRHCEEEIIRLTFNSPLDVLKHLKATGVTATGNGLWTKGMQASFCNRYREQFPAANNQVTLTYRPLYVVAIKK